MASTALGPANVLAYGSVNGHIDKLLKTVAKALTQRAFSAIFISGDLFAPPSPNNSHATDAVAQSVLDGVLAFPIPTFFIAGKSPLPRAILERIKAVRNSPIEVVQVANNLFFCSGSGIHIEPTSGLRFAYLSGTFDPTRFSIPADSNTPHRYTNDLINHLLATPDEHIPLDILLTYESPVNMSTLPAQGPLLSACQSPVLTAVVNVLMPRYHFCGGPGAFVERIPFAHVVDLAQVRQQGAQFTRFLSIAPVPGPGEKPTAGKWAYAFAVMPFMLKFGQEQLDPLPDGCTASPLLAISGPAHGSRGENKRAHQDDPMGGDSQLAKRQRANEHGSDTRQYGNDRPPYEPLQECWFCLPCPKADRNLVFTVGTHMYGAVAKGQLLPGHVLFIPRAHVQNWHRIHIEPEVQDYQPPVREATTAMQELCSMQRLATEMHARQGKISATWQIMDIKPNGAMHSHCQVVPLEVGEEAEKVKLEWIMKRLVGTQEDQQPEQDAQQDEPPFICVDHEMQEQQDRDDQAYTGPVSPTAADAPSMEPPTRTVIDRIAAAFSTKLAAFGLHPITYRLPATGSTDHLGSLTATLYHLRAYQLAQIADPVRKRSGAPRISVINPNMRHIAMLAGDRLMFVPIHDKRLRFPFSLPREAVATGLGMGGESALWRDRAGEEGERDKEYAVASELAAIWKDMFGENEKTGVDEVDARLALVEKAAEENGGEEKQVQKKEYDLSGIDLDRGYFQRNGGWTWDHFTRVMQEDAGAAQE
ncbi:hypothetical protein BCR44DRAFT_59444 [Catenaria anguillulae PL171]|uniref:Cwf19-like C-terminal domain-containing protein n=1 Tax=Catenaria anguillulae PL171 TaxID=765915 RepID=A0A1Y2HWQ7_9FUNG|nr:hypothetical protein BCR44DRAFT_59444 [Catenaria anguillulae PL171]